MLKVDMIDKGTVVDHIKAGKGAKVLEILGIDEDYPNRVALMMHVPSKKGGSKDIVKIAEKLVDEKDANIIALISPGCSVNIIENQQVSRKFRVELPGSLDGAGRCPNPNCVTESENDVSQMFCKEGEDHYRCHYCERLFKAEELV
jgi:aspartate carbamoyltransferase regulatory subunit